MKKFQKEGVPLFIAAIALCAFVMPSAASAASWSVVNTHHTLDSANFSLAFTHPAVHFTTTCAASTFTADVTSAQILTITTASFRACTATGTAGGTDLGHCTATPTGTRFPWAATAVTTANIQIHNIHIDLRMENMPPPAPANSCVLNNSVYSITGTVSGGTWSTSQHQITFTAASGLVADISETTQTVLVSGTLRDTQQSLNVSN